MVRRTRSVRPAAVELAHKDHKSACPCAARIGSAYDVIDKEDISTSEQQVKRWQSIARYPVGFVRYLRRVRNTALTQHRPSLQDITKPSIGAGSGEQTKAATWDGVDIDHTDCTDGGNG